MFENLSTVTKVLGGLTVVALVATGISAVVDHRSAEECCCGEDECAEACECCCEELADPTANVE